MNAMLERVCRVFAKNRINDDDFIRQCRTDQEEIDRLWPCFELDAREVIEAMREPTPEMVKAWENEDRRELRGMLLEDVFVERFWPAAINEALK